MKRILTPVLCVAALCVLSCALALHVYASHDAPPQASETLPSDVHPNTLSRMPAVTPDDLTTPEDKQAYDHLVAAEPRFGKPSDGPLGGTGTRLHIPVVADAYRTALNNLREKNGVDEKYIELATMVACRESNNELEWLSHQGRATKLNSPEVIELIRNKQDPKSAGEKEKVIILFGREMTHDPKVSSKTFADMERLFGTRGTLAIALTMGYYENNASLFRAYDQHIAVGAKHPFPDVAEQ